MSLERAVLVDLGLTLSPGPSEVLPVEISAGWVRAVALVLGGDRDD